MTLGGVISMKYEDADILAFISDKPKKDLAPQINSGAEENAGLKESPEEENPESKIEETAVSKVLLKATS